MDVITKDFTVTLGASFAESFSPFAATRHVCFCSFRSVINPIASNSRIYITKDDLLGNLTQLSLVQETQYTTKVTDSFNDICTCHCHVLNLLSKGKTLTQLNPNCFRPLRTKNSLSNIIHRRYFGEENFKRTQNARKHFLDQRLTSK